MKQPCAVILFALVILAGVSYAQDQSTMSVPEIAICTSVADRQPVGIDSVFSADVQQLTCFTKIVSQADQSEVSHVWFYGDKQMAKIDLQVKGPSFHTWSRKTILPSWKGEWRVEIQDQAGAVLSKISFKIQ